MAYNPRIGAIIYLLAAGIFLYRGFFEQRRTVYIVLGVVLLIIAITRLLRAPRVPPAA